MRKLVATSRGLLMGLGLMLVALLAFGATAVAVSPPGVLSESATSRSSSEATLNATIESPGTPADYYFEYGTSELYGSTTPEELYSSQAKTVVEGLAPETTYHFRVVAKNQYGTSYGADATFSTAPVASLILPDARRYEKVSPNANADGNVVTPAPSILATTAGDYTRLPFVAAADGNAVAYVGDPSEAGGNGDEGDGGGNEYLARRSLSGGWASENIEPASGEISERTVYEGFSKNLTSGVLAYNGLVPLLSGAPGERYRVLYKRDLATQVFEPLFTVKPPNRGVEEFTAANIPTDAQYGYEPAYAGGSADLTHVLFMANDALTANAIDGGRNQNNLYDSHDGVPTLVNVLPNGSTEPNATFGGPVLASDLPAVDAPSFSHDISEDGSRIFWTDLNNGDLYLREDASRTVQVDAGVGGGGMFWTATPDGSKALFTKGGDVYEYDVESGQTMDLVPGAEAQGILGTSEDLSYVYFVADAALAAGAETQSCVPSSETSSCNLYVLHRGEPVRFIGKLSSKDNRAFPQTFIEDEGDWQTGMGEKEAEVTPDGLHLVFGSVNPLTGYDSKEVEEVFTYDYGSARLLCASCNPSGEPPSSGRHVAFLPTTDLNAYTKRWISSDGTKVFFDSGDALVPQDTDGVVDVYEWEQDGTGGCKRAQGCIYLLSAGSSPESSWLIDTSESGEDVFIVTRSQLTLEDQNETVDVYDVRANAPLPPAPPQCSGTGCQGIPSSPPVFATPSSVTYNGVGNFPAPAKVSGAKKKPTTKKKQKKKKKKAKKKSKGTRHKAKKSARKSAKSHGRSK